MKKTLSFLLSLALVVLLVRCNQQDSETAVSKPYKVSNEGILSFDSEQNFEELASKGTVIKAANFVSRAQVLSSAKTSNDASLKRFTKNPDNLVYEDFPLLKYLNKDNLVEIEGRLFKVDFDKEIVGVVEDKSSESIELLKNGELSNGKVKWFLFTDNVFELLENGSKGTVKGENDIPNYAIASKTTLRTASHPDPTFTCPTEPGIESERDWDKATVFERIANANPSHEECRFWEADAKHVYQRTGIYYSLQSKIKYTRTPNSCFSNQRVQQTTDLTLTVTWDYCRKRRFRSCERSTGQRSYSAVDHELSHRTYEGSRSLERYRLNTTFTYKRRDPCSDHITNKVRTIVMPEISKS